MAYVCPDKGWELIQDQFMLGTDILVAPVLEKGMRERMVLFPPGKWASADGSVLEGTLTLKIDVPLKKLPWYRRIK